MRLWLVGVRPNAVVARMVVRVCGCRRCGGVLIIIIVVVVFIVVVTQVEKAVLHSRGSGQRAKVVGHEVALGSVK